MFRIEERFCLITYCVFEKQSWLRNNDTYQWRLNFCYTQSSVQLGQWQIEPNWVPKCKGEKLPGSRVQGRGRQHCGHKDTRNVADDLRSGTQDLVPPGRRETSELKSSSPPLCSLRATHQITNDRFPTSKTILNLFLLMEYLRKNKGRPRE